MQGDALLKKLNSSIVSCRQCPRLVTFREQVPARAAFKEQHYWRKPVPGFGDPNAYLLLVGLAPAAHGANRTGRIFTGDPSAQFLFRALYHEGFANQQTSLSLDDGLELISCYMTAAVKCVPPNNKPTRLEQATCSQYFVSELALLKKLTAVLVLGRLAHHAYLHYLKERGVDIQGAFFSHGKKWCLDSFPTMYCSYHPSPQNTYTGRLTQRMLRQVLQEIKRDRKSD